MGINVELLDTKNALIGTVAVPMGQTYTVPTGIRITTGPADFTLPRKATIAAWRLCVGEDSVYARLPNPPTISAGEIYRINKVSINVKIRGDIDFGPNGGGDDPSRPQYMPEPSRGLLSRLVSRLVGG